MTEIQYLDKEPDLPAYATRILILGDRMRIDYGNDDEGFILYVRSANMVWHVSPGDHRLTGIKSGKIEEMWPTDWKLRLEDTPSKQEVITQLRLNDVVCVEFKHLPLLEFETQLLADFRHALAANQAKAWELTPSELQQPCTLAVDVQQAGVEYRYGLPLAIRYWDGRSRVYQKHIKRVSNPNLFELPANYSRFVIGNDDGNSIKSQPSSSQDK